MKQIVLFILGCATAAACHTITPNSQSGTISSTDSSKNQIAVADTSLSGTWYLKPALPSDTITGRFPKISFTLTAQTFTGFTGCNSMAGSFKKDGSDLVFGKNIISTKMACIGYNERAFLENLLKTNNYSIEEGILLLKSDNVILSTWSRTMDTSKIRKM
ncbi:MAG: META domain-containing protein [Filimonas sp.]|nr:META domain-containing protein [Filimonas sp.]